MEYALVGTYKAMIGNEVGQTSFVIRMVEFQEKTLFIMYLQRSENSTMDMNNQLSMCIHDALARKQFINDQYIHEVEISDKGHLHIFHGHIVLMQNVFASLHLKADPMKQANCWDLDMDHLDIIAQVLGPHGDKPYELV